jgi:nucleotide-binding universal stress UspA family protein
LSEAENPQIWQRVLVAIAMSGEAKRVAATAIRASKSGDSVLTVFHVRELSAGLAGGEVEVESKEEADKERSEVERMFDDILLSAEKQGVKAKKVIKDHEKSVAQTILEYVEQEKIDLVVIGATGRTGLKKLVLGSVASELVKRVQSSLLIVRLERLSEQT